jgi:signal recognition particle GTPase
MTGQEAVTVATTFKERVAVSGIVLTKLDAMHAGVLRSRCAR